MRTARLLAAVAALALLASGCNAITRLSVSSSGGQFSRQSGQPSVSDDGGIVAFVSYQSLDPADTDNDLVRAYDLDTGTMTTVAGTGERGAGEDGLPPLETALNRPFGIDVGADGALYIADTYNHVIPKVIP